MKRIGIHTIIDYVNYGNRLQNYATQEILKSLGYEVETIVNYPTKPTEKGLSYFYKRILNVLTLSPISLINKIGEKVNDSQNKSIFIACQAAKAKAFKSFSDKYITESNFTLRLNSIPKDIDKKYDFVVVGSDQIWNPNIRYGSNLDFLYYVPKAKRIALAPSFGVSVIPEKYKILYAEYLSQMEFLSVREEKGKEMIENLCGRNAEVLVDPTLVVNSEKWLAISTRGEHKPHQKYLLTYFIGAVSKKRLTILQNMAARNNLELVMLNSLFDTKNYAANPAEFLDYINSASLVCTDSFHCIIFSLHFEKPFVVFDREGKSAPMGSRIDTLLKKFHFEDRKHHSLENTQKYFDIDFKHVPGIIDKERVKVIDYLEKALQE